jgi:hypothetical protein
MSKYTNIPVQDMRAFLQTGKGWEEEVQGKEIVFKFNLKNHPWIQIKVFSGILAVGGDSRACGKDAIRVCAVNFKTNSGWIKTSRVYRVEGWKNNLKTRVLQVITDAKNRLKQTTIRSNPNRFNQPNPILNKTNYRAEMEVMRLESEQE